MNLELIKKKAEASALLLSIEEREERDQNFQTQLEYYRTNPLDYIVERLGIKKETLDWLLLTEYKKHRWDGTINPFIKIMNALVNHRWVGVESGTGTGKTMFGACIVLWFLECFENSLVVTTAPKRDQLSLHIWREINRLYSKFNRGELLSLKLKMKEESDDWLAVGFVAGVKADEDSSTKAQGFHAEHMLIILEEIPGIPQPIITAFQNTSVGPHNLILAFGNPDHQLDNLHKFCQLDRVEHIRISGLDHPNVVLKDANFIPGAQSEQGIKDMKSRYGDEMHPLYLSRARGISPAQASDSLIKINWCSDATKRFLEFCDVTGKIDESKIEGLRMIGVDVANSESGDKAAIAEGKGNVLLKIEDFSCPDSNQLGHQVYRMMKEKGIKNNCVGVDGVGVGAGTVNTLKEYGISGKNVNLQSASEPVDLNQEEEFNNLRSQMWWTMREDLRNGLIALPDDQDLIADLVTPKWFVRSGKIVIESKEDIKKRLGRSPNKGDAAVYWNWVRNQGGFEVTITTKATRRSKEIIAGY